MSRAGKWLSGTVPDSLLVRKRLTALSDRVDQQYAIVRPMFRLADLRLTAARYPADQQLKQLIRDLAAQSPRFVKLWESGILEPYQDFGRRKVTDHPDVGHITLDCTRSSLLPTICTS
jgi:MmyB-like transcription regulator ligand binding domain